MILAEPPYSQGDIHFKLFGFPVRVHPFFWVIALLLGLRGEAVPAEVFIWVGAMFVSILVHEFGHAFMQRYYGGNPRVVLYAMGGLAISDDDHRSSRAQILISLAGPMAGFLLATILIVCLNLTGHQAGISLDSPNINGQLIELLGTNLYWESFASPHVTNLVGSLLYINILWGIVNLLPIYPLDGGKISRELCQMRHPSGGIVLSLKISMVTGIAVAIYGLLQGEFFLVLMFGYLAYSSYTTLEQYQASRW